MARTNPSTREKAIQAIDKLVGNIETFPEETRPYRELYEVG